jgi:hypothetical protein
MKIEKTNTITINDQRLVVTKTERQPALPSEQIDQSGNENHVYNIRQFPKTFYQISLFSDNDFHRGQIRELTDDLARALRDALNEFL